MQKLNVTLTLKGHSMMIMKEEAAAGIQRYYSRRVEREEEVRKRESGICSKRVSERASQSISISGRRKYQQGLRRPRDDGDDDDDDDSVFLSLSPCAYIRMGF